MIPPPEAASDRARLQAVVDDTLAQAAHAIGAAERRAGGWDSHATVQIIFAVEEAFGFQMTSAEMEAVTDLDSLAAIVARHRPS